MAIVKESYTVYECFKNSVSPAITEKLDFGIITAGDRRQCLIDEFKKAFQHVMAGV